MGIGNFYRLFGCIKWIRKDSDGATEYFGKAYINYCEAGCTLGAALCEAALGYIKY